MLRKMTVLLLERFSFDAMILFGTYFVDEYVTILYKQCAIQGGLFPEPVIRKKHRTK